MVSAAEFEVTHGRFIFRCCNLFSGELLSPVCGDGMEGAGADEAGAASSSVVVDSDDSLPQPTPIPLVETIDEPLGPDIIAGTPGTSSVFQSALVTPPE